MDRKIALFSLFLDVCLFDGLVGVFIFFSFCANSQTGFGITQTQPLLLQSQASSPKIRKKREKTN